MTVGMKVLDLSLLILSLVGCRAHQGGDFTSTDALQAGQGEDPNVCWVRLPDQPRVKLEDFNDGQVVIFGNDGTITVPKPEDAMAMSAALDSMKIANASPCKAEALSEYDLAFLDRIGANRSLALGGDLTILIGGRTFVGRRNKLDLCKGDNGQVLKIGKIGGDRTTKIRRIMDWCF